MAYVLSWGAIGPQITPWRWLARSPAGSGGRGRTCGLPVNGRALCPLSCAGPAAYLAGREPGDAGTRFAELVPPYQELAANLG